MPAVGDQHRLNGAGTTNPFDDPKSRMSEYTAQEIATLQSRLDKQLGPEFISSRPGAGGKKVHYVAAEKVISLANEVFGFNGWSSSIQNVQIDFVEENPTTGRVRLGLSVIVRVTLRDGSYHEDIGYGQIDNCPGKAAAFEKCKKEGTTDGLKRALRTFGNVLGNCVYDKDFVQRVTKIKPEPSRWNPDNLHRHTDYALIKKDMIDEDNSRTTVDSGDVSGRYADEEFGDVFDEADFNENDARNPDESVTDAEPAQRRTTTNSTMQPTRTESRVSTTQQPNAATPSKSSRPPDSAAQAAHIARQRQQAIERRNAALAAQKMQPPPNPGPQPRTTSLQPHLQNSSSNQSSSSPGMPSEHFNHQPDDPSLVPVPFDPTTTTSDLPPPPNPPVSFLSARAIAAPDPSTTLPPPTTVQFNPHAESPSIRKTAGIDHTRSGKIVRDSATGKPIPADPTAPAEAKPGFGAPPGFAAPPGFGPAANATISAGTRDFVNPSMDANRRIGSPMAPGMTTKAYRAPTLKRPMDSGGIPRQPLSDVGNLPPTAGGDTGGDWVNKRPRTIGTGGTANENVNTGPR